MSDHQNQPDDSGTVTVTTPAPQTAPEPWPDQPAVAVPDEPPVPRSSPLSSLRKIRERNLDNLFIDLRVPRWGDDGPESGPRIYVRYRPADMVDANERMRAAQKAHDALTAKAKRRGAGDKDYIIREHAQTLVNACIGVWAWQGTEGPEMPPPDREADRSGYELWRAQALSLRDGDPYGEWTRFDPDLAYALGLDEHAGAITVVRNLYYTDSDIITATNRLASWSGVEMPSAAGDFTEP